MNKLIRYFFRIKNKKFNNSLEEAQNRANSLHDKKSNAVVCIYCGKWLIKEESAMYMILKMTLWNTHMKIVGNQIMK